MTAPNRATDSSLSDLNGPLPVEDCLTILHALSHQVRALHESGQLHRQIKPFTLRVFAPSREHLPRCELAASSATPVEFGGPFADPDLCPPALRRSASVRIPSSIEATRGIFASSGIGDPPERIDLFQLGTLLGRLTTGKSIQAYLSSPAMMMRVPKPLRKIIDACTGYDESSRIDSASNLTALIEAAAAELHIELSNSGPNSKDEAKSAGEATTLFRPAKADAETTVTSSAETAVRRPPFRQLGHFDIGDEIGHGGMGTVYRAFDRTLDRTVAVKVLSPRFGRDPDFVKRFQAEASAAARLAHSNIVPIFFIGEDSGRHFYAMQFVEGESLAERLHRTPKLPREEALAIVYQMLQGLGAAHRQGLVHRDIKPGNIMIDRMNGQAMLTDFGLARAVAAPDDADGDYVMGTAEYMSPEQARGDEVDIRSDLYSVGVLLYQLLSGTTPFDADTPSSQLLQHVFHPPKSLREASPDIEPELIAIVERLLEKHPDSRYRTVEELLIDLEAAHESSTDREATHGEIVAGDTQLTARAGHVEATAPFAFRRFAPKLAAVALLAVFFFIVRNLSDPNAGADANRLIVHGDAVRSLVFSPDGTKVVSGGGRTSSLQDAGDTSLRLWDAETGKLLAVSDRLPSRPDRLVFLDDVRRVVALSSSREGVGTTIVWDTQTGRLGREEFHEPFAFHFDAIQQTGGTILASGNRGLTQLVVTGLKPSVTSPSALVFTSPARAIAHSPLAQTPLLFVGTQSGEDHFVAGLDARSHREQFRLHSPGPILAVVASPDGRTVVARVLVEVPREDGKVKSAFDFVLAWKLPSREPRSFGPFAPGSRGLAMTPEGQRVLTIAEPSIGPRSDAMQEAVLLDVETGSEVCRFTSKSTQLTTVAIAPKGDLAAIADVEGRVTICRLPR